MRHDETLAQALVQRERHALAHAARSGEDQGRAVAADLLGDPIVDLAPHLLARDRAKLVGRHLDRELHRATMADIYDARPRAQEAGDFFERPHGGREPDALRFAARLAEHQIVEAREREREVRAALISRHRVNLVNDDARNSREERARTLCRKQDEERFGRRDEHVRRLAQHARALGGRGIARAHGRADLRERRPAVACKLGELCERALQVLSNVVGERLERRDVHGEGAVRQRPLGGCAHEIVNGEREGG